MNVFDYSIISFFNQFVGQHPGFDNAVVYLSNSGFSRAGPIAALCWWAWFKYGQDTNDRNVEIRQCIVSTLLVCFASILLARFSVLLFPFRVRPLSDPTNGLHFPPGTTDWQNWSSFPSDHAIMFFTLTTCLFFASRVLGWFALIDTVILVCLPRIYLGIHYPTDILAGALIGVALGCAASHKEVRSFLAGPPMHWMQLHPGPFYAVFFVLMYQMTIIFSDVRYVGIGLIKTCAKLLR
jgi:undecaprenyl-diphosphatase